MKRLIFIVFLVNVVLPLTSLAQDNTKAGLPEGAIARLGKGGINIIRFSPDGTRLAGCLVSGSADGTIRFWDPNTGQQLLTFTNRMGKSRRVLRKRGQENR